MTKRFLRIGFWSIMAFFVPIACYTWWHAWAQSLSDFSRGLFLPFLVIMTLGTIGVECCIIWFELLGKELTEEK